MAWTNIFDLAEWQVYVQFSGQTLFPDPDSTARLVRAEDLDPAVGTVEIVEGEIVLNLEAVSGGGGMAPLIVVMPVGAPPQAAMARASATIDFGGGAVTMQTSSDQSSIFSVSSVSPEADGFAYDQGSVSLDLGAGIAYAELAYPTEIPSGEGLAVREVSVGF
jgi:hypothetical protein